MEEQKHTVKVNIYGEDYPIKADIDSSYIIRVAQYVDKKMREAADRSPHRIPVKVAVLAAMNIADELFKEREDKDKKLSLVEEKAQTLLEWLDKRLVQE
jgi:cell division protein ZapA